MLAACGQPPDPPDGKDGGQPDGPDGGIACTVQAPTSCPNPPPTYSDVQPIFQSRCVVCHASDWSGPWPLTDYQHVSDWQIDIRADLLSCSMPPADAGFTLPDEESAKILTWIRCGLPK